ncbi:hypothetical protein LCGC14_2782600 [marine sediment metagenome]|uniref:Uncharacterized protein n=1 Tax=marine sediment metagenome TaxID=412755 RepID=A0A0F9BJE6_9ZZZZ
MANNELYKLKTRRVIGFLVGGISILTIAFVGVWGTVNSQIELVTLAIGILGTTLGSIVVFYFSRKVSEE